VNRSSKAEAHGFHDSWLLINSRDEVNEQPKAAPIDWLKTTVYSEHLEAWELIG